jgi:hypothetical protein
MKSTAIAFPFPSRMIDESNNVIRAIVAAHRRRERSRLDRAKPGTSGDQPKEA